MRRMVKKALSGKCLNKCEIRYHHSLMHDGVSLALTRAQLRKRARREADVVTIGLWLE